MYGNLEILERYAATAVIGLAFHASGKVSEEVRDGLENAVRFFELAEETPEVMRVPGAQLYMEYRDRLEHSLKQMGTLPPKLNTGSIKVARDYFSDWLEILKEAEQERELDALPAELYTQETEVINYQRI